MATKKYLSLERLGEYDELIKAEIASGDSSTLSSAKSYADGLASGKSDSGHTHDDRYYTESEIDSKLSSVNSSITNITSGTTVVKKAEHATTADSATTANSATTAASATTAGSATKATQDGNGKVISSTYETKTDASAKLTEAKGYTDTVASGKADADHNHDAAYDTKGAADGALASAKTYADSAAAKVKNDLLNGAGTAYDTLKELGDLIDDNQDAIEALETVASGKADAVHGHAISDVSGLQSALDGKAASSHGTHVSFDSTNKPKMDGTAAFGTSSKVARADHVHPTDTSRASQADLDALEAVVDGKANSSHTHTVSQISDLTATATELNYMDGVTSGVQGQIDTISGNLSTHTGNSDIHFTAAERTKLAGIATGANKITVDSALSSTSTNPVQNKVINSSIVSLTSTISTNTSSISAHTTRITALEDKVGDGFEEITSQEILDLFS